MKCRCNNPNQHDYQYYGGRGITYDPAWETWEGFLADMGLRPDGMTLDRIDVDGPYCKENCRWADAQTQGSNCRVMRLCEVGPMHGITHRTPNCYTVQLSVDNKSHYFGCRSTLEEAIILRDESLAWREQQRGAG